MCVVGKECICMGILGGNECIWGFVWVWVYGGLCGGGGVRVCVSARARECVFVCVRVFGGIHNGVFVCMHIFCVCVCVSQIKTLGPRFSSFYL